MLSRVDVGQEGGRGGHKEGGSVSCSLRSPDRKSTGAPYLDTRSVGKIFVQEPEDDTLDVAGVGRGVIPQFPNWRSPSNRA